MKGNRVREKRGCCILWGDNPLHMLCLPGVTPWLSVPRAVERCPTSSAHTACQVIDATFPLQMAYNSLWCLVQKLAQSLVLQKDFFLLLNKEYPLLPQETKAAIQIRAGAVFIACFLGSSANTLNFRIADKCIKWEHIAFRGHVAILPKCRIA